MNKTNKKELEEKADILAAVAVVCAFYLPMFLMFAILIFTNITEQVFDLLIGAILFVCMFGSYFLYSHWWKKNMIEHSKPKKDGLVVTDPQGKMKDCKNKNMLFIGTSESGKTNPWCMPQLNLKPCPCGCETMPFLMFEKGKVIFAGEDLYVENVFAICGMCGRHTEKSNVLTAVDNWNNDIIIDEKDNTKTELRDNLLT